MGVFRKLGVCKIQFRPHWCAKFNIGNLGSAKFNLDHMGSAKFILDHLGSAKFI